MISLSLAAAMLAGCGSASEPAPRPPLHVMTALPLFWGEGGPVDIVQGQGGRSPVLAALDADYQVTPVDILNAETLETAQRLILAQPTALRPEELVALDDWVRKGGQLLVFADPELLWPSAMSIGDPRRAPVRSLLGPLLSHWGLTLNLPKAQTPAIALGKIDGNLVSLVQPGRWSVQSGACRISDDALLARCRIGKGQAVLVADADMLDARVWAESRVDNRASVSRLVTELTPS
jgi:ABC-type uncharacterized transport system